MVQEKGINHALHPYFAQFRGFRSYEHLKKSSIYKRVGNDLEGVLNSCEFFTADLAYVNPKPFLRAVAWNIERGIYLDEIIHALHSHPVLRHADLLFISEADIGMVRSANRNVAAELAKALGFNYFFGTSYLNLEKGNGGERDSDGDNTLGLHGNVLLSRYPIANPHLISLKNCKNKLKGREKRLGSQKAILAEIDLPDGKRMAAVCVHLDAHSSQRQRVEQMRTILDAVVLRGNPYPVLVGGDWNTSTYNASHAIFAFLGFWWRVANGVTHIIKNHYPYPERRFEKRLFNMVEARGYDYRRLNDIGVGTVHYSIDDIKTNKSMKDWLPQWCITILNNTLKPVGGCASLKLDWFIGRGILPVDLSDEGFYGDSAPVPLPPKVIPCPKLASGTPVSDHDPIVLDFVI